MSDRDLYKQAIETRRLEHEALAAAIILRRRQSTRAGQIELLKEAESAARRAKAWETTWQVVAVPFLVLWTLIKWVCVIVGYIFAFAIAMAVADDVARYARNLGKDDDWKPQG